MASTTLHVAYGDALANSLLEFEPSADVLVVREALRDGPLVSLEEGTDAFLQIRARHLAAAHGADEVQVHAELSAAWTRLVEHEGDIELHVDERACIDCATFAAASLELLSCSGRALARSQTGIAITRGAAPGARSVLAPRDVAAAAGAWRLLVEADAAGLQLAAADDSERGGIAGFPELTELLVTRARGDVDLADVLQ